MYLLPNCSPSTLQLQVLSKYSLSTLQVRSKYAPSTLQVLSNDWQSQYILLQNVGVMKFNWTKHDDVSQADGFFLIR